MPRAIRGRMEEHGMHEVNKRVRGGAHVGRCA